MKTEKAINKVKRLSERANALFALMEKDGDGCASRKSLEEEYNKVLDRMGNIIQGQLDKSINVKISDLQDMRDRAKELVDYTKLLQETAQSKGDKDAEDVFIRMRFYMQGGYDTIDGIIKMFDK